MDASGQEITPEFEMSAERNSFVDQVTLELLVNKSQYHKLVSKNNPEEGHKIQSHYNEIDEYKDVILDLTEELLTNRYKNVSTEVNDLFDGYVKAVINHYKMKEIESRNDYNKYDEVDVMFDRMHEETEPINVDKSVWGGSIVKRNKY
tara:strand:- start:1043 stop:1486 length:444 start_codon:yes stop_codon:yes gene_type:complete